MSYQVLARKYRPTSFKQLVGQEYVLRALTNALDSNRLHHAYLFTGTRGVGKTTVARVLARCLNCDTGITSSPCGSCSSCVEITDGRSVDLIEVDAASRTGVEDTLELLENVQYLPSYARFKVYLIDEVHMFSRSSFNALLKTLEEPPEHVKFLLVTTDPKKLPITVLSRCLQFNLKNMTPGRVVEHLRHVLDAEGIESEDGALWQLGRAADGSMRDALSLTDQAIAFGGGRLTETDVRSLLGTLDPGSVFVLLTALVEQDGARLLQEIDRLADYSVDFAAMLDEVLSVLHRLAVLQAVPDSLGMEQSDREQLLELADRIRREDLQLYYQIGLIGRRDLPLAPSLRIGFEMIMLRMLTFTPELQSYRPPVPVTGKTDDIVQGKQERDSASDRSGKSPAELILQSLSSSREGAGEGRSSTSSQLSSTAPAIEEATVAAKSTPDSVADSVEALHENREPGPAVEKVPQPATGSDSSGPEPAAESSACNERWMQLLPQLGLKGATLSLASSWVLLRTQGDHWQFALSPGFSTLHSQTREEDIAEALGSLLGQPVRLRVDFRETDLETPDERRRRTAEEARQKAVESIRSDPNINILIQEFDASVEEASIVSRLPLG